MNLVNELQTSAEKDGVLTVLRKTKRLASKLDRNDLAEWLKAEQGGYAPGQAVPAYRKVVTTLAYHTNGYIPAGYGQIKSGVEDLPALDLTPPASVRESISTILSWIENLDKGNEVYNCIPEDSDYGRALRKIVRFNPMFAHQISFMAHLNGPQIRAIPEQIKDKVLDWACDLEHAGVRGENLSFTPEEKQIAHSITFNISGCSIEQLNNLGTNLKSKQ